MSINAIYQLQAAIYKALQEDVDLAKTLQAIYFSIQRDAKFPYLLINNINCENLSSLHHEKYVIDFEITLFTRESKIKNYFSLAEIIRKKITQDSFDIEGYNLISLNNYATDIANGHDLLTTKICQKFKLIIAKANL